MFFCSSVFQKPCSLVPLSFKTCLSCRTSLTWYGSETVPPTLPLTNGFFTFHLNNHATNQPNHYPLLRHSRGQRLSGCRHRPLASSAGFQIYWLPFRGAIGWRGGAWPTNCRSGRTLQGKKHYIHWGMLHRRSVCRWQATERHTNRESKESSQGSANPIEAPLPKRRNKRTP